MSRGQTGHKPGGVPPKFFMFIVFFSFPKYIYIYIYVCVCVCLSEAVSASRPVAFFTLVTLLPCSSIQAVARALLVKDHGAYRRRHNACGR